MNQSHVFLCAGNEMPTSFAVFKKREDTGCETEVVGRNSDSQGACDSECIDSTHPCVFY